MLCDHVAHVTVDRQDNLGRIVKKITIDGDIALLYDPLDDPLRGCLDCGNNDNHSRIGRRRLHVRLDQVAIAAIKVQLSEVLRQLIVEIV